MDYLDDKTLEQSAVVANCCMNRERDLCGTNGYEVEIGFNPLDHLKGFVSKRGKARWLDLCCGTGKALTHAASIIDQEKYPIEIVGVDLVGMFFSHKFESLQLIEASLTSWGATTDFDLITCVHGLHYIGDKLGLIVRACSWLTDDGLFVANLDIKNLRLNPAAASHRSVLSEFRKSGLEYSQRKRLLQYNGKRRITLPFDYIGADDQAGPNYTRQPVVNSFYEESANQNG